MSSLKTKFHRDDEEVSMTLSSVILISKFMADDDNEIVGYGICTCDIEKTLHLEFFENIFFRNKFFGTFSKVIFLHQINSNKIAGKFC